MWWSWSEAAANQTAYNLILWSLTSNYFIDALAKSSTNVNSLIAFYLEINFLLLP